MGDWLIWLTFAGRILEILIKLLGEGSNFVAKVEDRMLDLVAHRLGDPPSVPVDEIDAEIRKKS